MCLQVFPSSRCSIVCYEGVGRCRWATAGAYNFRTTSAEAYLCLSFIPGVHPHLPRGRS